MWTHTCPFEGEIETGRGEPCSFCGLMEEDMDKEANAGGHAFNRRGSDPVVRALATRMKSMEGRVEVLEQQGGDHSRELVANTRICSQLHEAVKGKGEEKGLEEKVAEMHEVFTTAEKGFEYIGKAGDLVARGLAKGEKIARPLVWIAAAIAGGTLWWKTGEFRWPDWMPK